METLKFTQTDLLRKVSELIQKGNVDLNALLSIYEQSARISEQTGHVPKQLNDENNPLCQIVGAAVKNFLTWTQPKIPSVLNRTINKQYVNQIYKKHNDQFIAENAPSILKYIEFMKDEELKKTYLTEMISFIGKHNVRTMRSEGIQNLLEIMDKYELYNKDVLMNLLPNIPTLLDENMQVIVNKGNKEITKRLTDISKHNFGKVLENYQSDEEKRVRKLVLKSYQMLFKNYNEDFRKLEYNLNGLSRLIEPVFDELDNQTILVSNQSY